MLFAIGRSQGHQPYVARLVILGLHCHGQVISPERLDLQRLPGAGVLELAVLFDVLHAQRRFALIGDLCINEAGDAGLVNAPAGQLIAVVLLKGAIDEFHIIVRDQLAIFDHEGGIFQRDRVGQVGVGDHDVVGVTQGQHGGDQVHPVFSTGLAEFLQVRLVMGIPGIDAVELVVQVGDAV